MNGLYIHIPFCVKKCDYCDFISYAHCEAHIDDYLDAIEREASEYTGTVVDSIFIGGGTPSILSDRQIYRIGDVIHKHFVLTTDYEFTTEANPGTITDEKLLAFNRIGVNRISIGVQSFHDSELKVLGRIHNSEAAVSSVNLASGYFDNISIDLMTALPKQTKQGLIQNVDIALSLPIKHISCYGLIIEPGTPFYERYSDGALLPNEEDDCAMNEALRNRLALNGFKRYEISNFALDGYESRHNLKYWLYEPYIGLGVAAHSFDGNKRYSNTNSIEEYINNPIAHGGEETLLSAEDKMSEFMFLGLRTGYGVSSERFKKLFGKTIESVFGDAISKHICNGLLEKTNAGYRLTQKAINVSNAVLCDFV